VSQILTLYTTPMIYLLLDRLHRRLWGTADGRIQPNVAHPQFGPAE
jgi:multidrug efflux pump